MTQAYGANRLGSNSLLDIIVFGRAAAHRVVETVRPGASHAPVPKEVSDLAIARLTAPSFAMAGCWTRV